MVLGLDPSARTEMKMILPRHVEDLTVSGWNSDMDSLGKYPNTLFRTNILEEPVQYHGCSFVRNENRTLMIHPKVCLDKMVECFDVSTKSNTPTLITTDLRPKGQLEDRFKGPCWQLLGGQR